MIKQLVCSLFLLASSHVVIAQQDYPFRDTELPIEARVNDLVSRLTLSEKVQLMKHQSPAIERLVIPAYNWWERGAARSSPHAGKSDCLPPSDCPGGDIRHGSHAEKCGYDLIGRAGALQ